MKPALLTVVLLLIGIGTGYYVGSSGALPGARGSPVDTREVLDLRERRVEDLERIRQFEAEIADLKRQLASKPEEEEPYPGDTPEELEKLLEAVYGVNNIDLFIEHGATPEGTNPAKVMTAFGDEGKLTPQQIADVIAYVISLNK